MLNNPIIQEGAVKPSSLEQQVYEGDLFAQRITEIPSNMQMRIAYDVSNRVEYVGFAPRSLAEGADGWLLHKFAYDGSSTRCVSRKIAYGNWTNHVSETYE